MENCTFTRSKWTRNVIIQSCINYDFSVRAVWFSLWLAEQTPYYSSLRSQNILGRRYASLANNVTDNFPSVDLILQYARPLTSWTMDQLPDTASWQPRQPRLPEIAALCEKFFSWGSSGDIVSRFKNSLWPGIAIQHLLQVWNKSFYTVCEGWRYFNPASHCWWIFSTICQWGHNSRTRTAYHTCPSNLSSPTWPRRSFNASRCNRLHNPDLDPWCYPWNSSWIGFWFTVAHPSSRICLCENFFLDPWFHSQGYIAQACQAVYGEESHSTDWKLLPCKPFLYVFNSYI